MSDLTGSSETLLRERVACLLKKRSDFPVHLFVHVIVNATLVTMWAIAGPASSAGCLIPLGDQRRSVTE